MPAKSWVKKQDDAAKAKRSEPADNWAPLESDADPRDPRKTAIDPQTLVKERADKSSGGQNL